MYKSIAAALGIAVLPLSAAFGSDSYTIDPLHSFPNFTIDRPVSTMYGRFDKMSGKVVLDRAAKTGTVEVNIETASITTGDSERGSRARTRDEHLRSADFFNAAEFPRITFRSTKVAFSGDNPGSIEGNLTMLGVTKPVVFTVDRFKCLPPSGNNRERCGGNATGKIKRSEFGMKFGIPNIGDEVTLMLEIEALKD